MRILRVALAQIDSIVGDLEGNVAKIVAAIGRAREESADIVTFPELAICGYPPEDLLFRPSFIRDSRDALEQVARQSEGIAAVVGVPDAMNGNLYNAAALIDDTRIVATYHKFELPNYGVFDENRYFSRGSRCLIFEMRGARIAVNICEDIWLMF